LLCLWLISMVTVCFPSLSPDLVFHSPPVPNTNTTYVVSCCTFGSFQYFQTPLHIYLLSHVMSPRIPPYGSLQVCINLATLLYIQAVGSQWTSLSCSFPTAVFNNAPPPLSKAPDRSEGTTPKIRQNARNLSGDSDFVNMSAGFWVPGI